MTSSGSDNTRNHTNALERFPGERPSLYDGKEWCRTTQLALKPEYRALLDGVEMRGMIQYRDAALLTPLTLTADTGAGRVTHSRVPDRGLRA